MRMPLLTKFFLSFLLTGVVLVGILISLIQFYAIQNFSDYVSRMEYSQLDDLVSILEREYKDKGNFDHLRQNPMTWLPLMNEAGLAPDIHSMVNGMAGRPMHRKPQAESLSNGARLPKAPSPDRQRMPHPPGKNELGPRVVLLDADKQLIMGAPQHADPTMIRPIPDQGDPVGYLGFNQPKNLSHPLDLRFLKQQKQSFYLAGGIFLLCSVLISFFLAAHLLAPIKKLSRATRALGKRQFDTRIDLNTRDELGQLAEDFNWLASTLGDYEQRQIHWLSDISHELRTPLSILRGELEAVQDGIRKLDNASVNSLHAEVTHLIRLVKDLHDLSMAEANIIRVSKQPVDIAALLAMTLERFSPRIEEKQTEVSVHAPGRTMVMGDPDRLIQLFSNLLKNSLAYTDPPGQLRITCQCRGNRIEFEVEDSAPEVPAPPASPAF